MIKYIISPGPILRLQPDLSQAQRSQGKDKGQTEGASQWESVKLPCASGGTALHNSNLTQFGLTRAPALAPCRKEQCLSGETAEQADLSTILMMRATAPLRTRGCVRYCPHCPGFVSAGFVTGDGSCYPCPSGQHLFHEGL